MLFDNQLSTEKYLVCAFCQSRSVVKLGKAAETPASLALIS